MKTILVAAVAGLTLGLAACEEKPTSSTPKPAAPPAGKAPATPPAAKPPTAPTGAAPAVTAPTGAVSNDLRDQAVAAFSAKYDEFKMQVTTLQEKAKEVPAAAKTAFDGAMTQLNSLTKDVETKLVELKNASGETIKKLQDSIDAAWPKIQEQITAAEKAMKGS